MASAPIIDRRALVDAPRADLVALAKRLVALKIQAAQVGPQTPDELHAFIKAKFGLHIPKIAVDVEHGHCSPFTFISDVYFEQIMDGEHEVSGALVVAGRECAKSSDVALIHVLNAHFKPGYWGISAGAVAEQSNRVYEILKELNANWGGDDSTSEDNGVVDSLKSITRYSNGSRVNVIGSTMAAMNGSHSNLLHRDEGELFRVDAFREGDNITRSGKTKDGRKIKAIDIVTSSRKFAKGLLQELLDEIEEHHKNGTVPRYKQYKWGIAETIAPVGNCRWAAKPGTPESELCPCRRVANGKMPDGTPRTLEKICGGRFARSDGWRPLEPDIVGKFLSNSPAMWEAQQECRKPASEGLILENFSLSTHAIRSWKPDPERGQIFNSNDIGSTHASASEWFQYTERAYSAIGYDGGWVVVPKDSYVFFDEVYITETGNNVFAQMIKAKEADWHAIYEHWEVCERYIDIAAKSQKLDFRDTHGLTTQWRLPTREVEPQIDRAAALVNDGRVFVVVDPDDKHVGSPMLAAEAEAWQRDPATGKPIERFDDAVAAGFRYGISNVERKLVKEGRHPHINRQQPDSAPGSADRAAYDPVQGTSALASEPETGPAFVEYLRGSPHEHEDLLPTRAHPMTEAEGRMGRREW